MRQLAAFGLALALGAAAAVALASCGGGEDAKLLPGTTAQQISENLDTVQRLAAEEECVGAADAAQEVGDEVEALTGVDPKLKEALQRGATKLNEVVTTCEEETTETAPTDEAPSTEETTKLPPGQEKKEEKELEKEEEKAEKEAEKEASSEPPTAPTETTPDEPTTPTAPPTEGGGTGAPGGVSPGTPVGPGGE
jgi:hypothetical protein